MPSKPCQRVAANDGGLRSDGSAFTVESLAAYFIHDPIHHLHDVSV